MTQIKRRTIVEGKKYTWEGNNDFFEEWKPFILRLVNGHMTCIDLLKEASPPIFVEIMRVCQMRLSVALKVNIR